MKMFDLNIFSLIVIISSIAIALYPLIYIGINSIEMSTVSEKFGTIEFALKHFFYTEGFGLISPSSVKISTLVQRYYLRKSPGKRYQLFWIDSDPSDGKVKAAIIYTGKVDPVVAAKKLKEPMWFDPIKKTVYEDYRENRKIAVVVEVVGSE